MSGTRPGWLPGGAEQCVSAKSSVRVDCRDGVVDPPHGSGDVQVGGVNADVSVVSIGCLPDGPIFRNLGDHAAPFLSGLFRPGDAPVIAYFPVGQEIYEEYRRGPGQQLTEAT